MRFSELRERGVLLIRGVRWDARGVIETVWHDQFIVNNPFNVVVTRDVVLELVRGGQIAYDRFERRIEAVTIIGDAAITMGEEHVVAAVGTPHSGRDVSRRYTHLWIRTGATWQLVGRHASIAADAT